MTGLLIRLKRRLTFTDGVLKVAEEIVPLLLLAYEDGYLGMAQLAIGDLMEIPSGSVLTMALLRAGEKGLVEGFVVTPTNTGHGVGYVWCLPFVLQLEMITVGGVIPSDRILWA